MTPRALARYVQKQFAGSYLAAAQQEADIADQWEGLGDPETDALALSHRAMSRALLLAACRRMSLPTFPRMEN